MRALIVPIFTLDPHFRTLSADDKKIFDILNKRQETKDKGQETRDKRRGTKDKGQETRDKRQEVTDEELAHVVTLQIGVLDSL